MCPCATIRPLGGPLAHSSRRSQRPLIPSLRANSDAGTAGLHSPGQPARRASMGYSGLHMRTQCEAPGAAYMSRPHIITRTGMPLLPARRRQRCGWSQAWISSSYACSASCRCARASSVPGQVGQCFQHRVVLSGDGRIAHEHRAASAGRSRAARQSASSARCWGTVRRRAGGRLSRRGSLRPCIRRCVAPMS